MLSECSICKEKCDGATEVYVRDTKKGKLVIDICDYCRQNILAVLMHQFIIEKWIPIELVEACQNAE